MTAALALLFASVTGGCWSPPVAASIAEPYRQPACTYCAGHRGVGYAIQPGTVVRAVASGTISFAGQVAGVLYVVVLHDDGLRTTYGNLQQDLVSSGQAVVAGQPVGLASNWLHFGLRDGDTYLDPTPLLGWWQGRPRLVPTDGGAARAGPPPRLICPAAP